MSRSARAGDFHIHTVFSRDVRDRTLTLDGIARRAAGKGLAMIGFADHFHPGFNAPEAGELEEARAFVSKRGEGVPALLGTEASIMDSRGGISIGTREADRFDYVIASMHPNFPGVEALPTSTSEAFLGFLHGTYMNTVLNPLVDVIGHPWNLHAKSIYDNTRSFWGICRVLGLSPSACFDRVPDPWLEEFAQAAKERGTAVEMNVYAMATREVGSLYGEDDDERNAFGSSYLRLFRILAKAGVRLSAGSDAHALSQVGDTLLLERYFDLLGLGAEAIWTPMERSRR
jgi:histidinol phosphatase-like PHP family hydrolase